MKDVSIGIVPKWSF